MGKKIVSAGHICLDIMPVFDPEKEMNTKELFQPGKLVEVGAAQMHVGGSVSNTGLAFDYFGADVTLMAKVGDDSFGRMLSHMVNGYGVQNKLLYSVGCSTSYTVVIAPPGVDRIFFHCPGANDWFGYEDIDFESVREADLFHFGYPSIMKKLYGNPQELVGIFRKAKELGTLTSLDLAAVADGTEAARVDWCSVLCELLPYVDYFVPSAEELCFLIDRERYREWMKRANGGDVTDVLKWEDDIRPLSKRLIQWGAKVVLIKCGTPGMYLKTGKIEDGQLPGKREWSQTEIFEKSYKADKFCSATGAGDVSIAAFLTAALEGYTPHRCLNLAAAAGACCVTAYDALGGLVPFPELEKRVDGGWQKQG